MLCSYCAEIWREKENRKPCEKEATQTLTTKAKHTFIYCDEHYHIAIKNGKEMGFI